MTSKTKKLPQYYCFATGRHSGSFYLKIGAAVFCMGHVIHMGLIVAKQISYFENDGDHGNLQCGRPEVLMNGILQPIYVFLQLFMIFKYSNVIVNRSKRLAR